jgi:hypothetical protein
LLAHGQWFSPGTPASSTPKTGRHDIAEIMLKVALNTINQIKSNRKTRPPNITNKLSIKNSRILMISVSENFLVEPKCFFFE